MFGLEMADGGIRAVKESMDTRHDCYPADFCYLVVFAVTTSCHGSNHVSPSNPKRVSERSAGYPDPTTQNHPKSNSKHFNPSTHTIPSP